MHKYIDAEKVGQFFATSGKIMVILFFGIGYGLVTPFVVTLMLLAVTNPQEWSHPFDYSYYQDYTDKLVKTKTLFVFLAVWYVHVSLFVAAFYDKTKEPDWVEWFFAISGKIIIGLFFGIGLFIFWPALIIYTIANLVLCQSWPDDKKLFPPCLFDNARTILFFCGVTITTLFVMISCVAFAVHCDNERKKKEKEKSQ